MVALKDLKALTAKTEAAIQKESAALQAGMQEETAILQAGMASLCAEIANTRAELVSAVRRIRFWTTVAIIFATGLIIAAVKFL